MSLLLQMMMKEQRLEREERRQEREEDLRRQHQERRVWFDLAMRSKNEDDHDETSDSQSSLGTLNALINLT